MKPRVSEDQPERLRPRCGHGERVACESNVITEYLDDIFPAAPLYHIDPWELARVKLWQSAEVLLLE